MSLCTYYNEKTCVCSSGGCTQGKLDKGKCTSKGEIFDKFQDKDVTAFEHNRNYRAF